MKLKLIIVALFISFTTPAFCNSFTELFFGAGVATKYGYNLGTCAGIDYVKAITWRLGVGFKLMYQNYSLYYNNDNQSLNNGTSFGGITITHTSSYVFLCPKAQMHLGRSGNTHFYIDAGVGFNAGGTESLHKWNHTEWPGQIGVPYDSTINTSKNITKLVYRFGVGLKEHFSIGRGWSLTLTEDLSLMPSALSSTADNNNLNSYNGRVFMPTYLSLLIGINHKS